MWKRVFSEKNTESSGAAAPEKVTANGHGSATRSYKQVLVPAIGRHFSERSLHMACRLAKGSGGTVILAYVIEVPRSLVLEGSMPEEEEMAEEVLEAGEAATKSYKVTVTSTVYRTRNVRDGVLALATEQEVDLLILATRADETRGLPADITSEIFGQARCEVILDHIIGD